MLFSDLPESAFEDLVFPIDNMLYSSGSVLYQEGDDDAVLYSMRSGLVKLLHLAADGSRRIVRLLGPGSTLGLELLDGDKGYRHTAVALSEVDVCRIPVATLSKLERAFPDLCRQVRNRLQDNLDRADQWIMTLNSGPASQRVAHLLLMLDTLSSHQNGDIELLGREDMAAIVGTSLETVCRIIADLRRKHIINRISHGLHHLDVAALRTLTHDRRAP